MRYTAQTLEAMREQAAIDAARAHSVTDEQMKDAPKPFGQYITVRQFCELTNASRGQVYYSIREAPVGMDAIHHGLWFIHIDIALDYADTLKARRLKRAGQLAKAAQRLVARNERRLKRAQAVSSSLDKRDERAASKNQTHPVEPDEHGRINVTQVGIYLVLSVSTASHLLKRHSIPKERSGHSVYVPFEAVKELQRERSRGQVSVAAD